MAQQRLAPIAHPSAPREFAMTEIPQTVLLARRMYYERKTVRAIQSASRLSFD
jgi:hypothetical protein